MEIEFDTQKDVANLSKHGVSLAFAQELEWETLLAMADTRQDYGENRMIGFALNGARLYCVVFTDRDNTRRIISLRKANNREKEMYADHH